jgi:hypothetical protein
LISSLALFTRLLLEKTYGKESSYYKEYGPGLNLTNVILSNGIAFVTQNMAYMCNISRWKILIVHLREKNHQNILDKEIA